MPSCIFRNIHHPPAMTNIQRSYEIYKLTTEGSITEEDIRKMFETSPQTIVNIIREKGDKIYSNKEPYRKPVIV